MNVNQPILEAVKYNLSLTGTAPGDHPLVQAIERRFAIDQGMTKHADPAKHFAIDMVKRALANSNAPSGVVLEGIYPKGSHQPPQMSIELRCSIRDDRQMHCETLNLFGTSSLDAASPVKLTINFGDTHEDSPRLLKESLHESHYQ